jgi:hypothetical protein
LIVRQVRGAASLIQRKDAKAQREQQATEKAYEENKWQRTPSKLWFNDFFVKATLLQ